MLAVKEQMYDNTREIDLDVQNMLKQCQLGYLHNTTKDTCTDQIITVMLLCF